jgi:DNA-binding NarL/FixJ family response regulator
MVTDAIESSRPDLSGWRNGMLMDKQITSVIAVTKSPAIGWVGGGTFVPNPATGLLEKNGHTFFFFKSSDEKIPADLPLVVIDCQELDTNGLQHELARLHERQSSLRLVLLGVASDVALEQLIRWPGVKGIFLAGCADDQLLKGMQSLLRGENWLPRRLLDQWLERQRSRIRPALMTVVEKLTEREWQILDRVGDANTNAQIAFDLCISEHTVKTHLYNIYRKIKVRNRTEACNWVKNNLQMAG